MSEAAANPDTSPVAERGASESRVPASVRHAIGVAGRPIASNPVLGLVGIILASAIVHGFRLLGPAFTGGDLLYHGALALSIVRDGLPLQGAYAGLPAYYPPGFHLALALPMALLGWSPLAADQLLFIVLLPVLPIGTYLLARRLTGRPWVAVLAAALTLFGGAYDLNPIRQWVNSLFLSGQASYPAYPRDLVFAVLPFAAWAFLRALGGDLATRRRIAWAALAGGLLGTAALVQVQLLLPVPFAFAAAALAVAIRDRNRRWVALAALVVSGLIAFALVAPWLAETIALIRRNAGVVLDSSDQLEPARFGSWSYPREFGIFLPLGLAGIGAVALMLRRPDGPRPAGVPGRWRSDPVEGGVLVAAWAVIPFVMGIAYDPGWPLEDALRPQRLWLIASQPLAILAAVGLVVVAEHFLARTRPRAVVPVIVLALVVACVPATLSTARTVAGSWTRDTYAQLDRVADRVPQFDQLLGTRGPRQTVLAPEEWSPLVWFEAGLPVVALNPPGYAKLAFDPDVFTGHAQDQRRADLADALRGDPSGLARVADAYAVTRIVVPRQGDLLAVRDSPAAVVARQGGLVGNGELVTGNGWDAERLRAGAEIVLPWTAPGDGALRVDVRLAEIFAGIRFGPRTLAFIAIDADGSRRTLATAVAPTSAGDWQTVRVEVRLTTGERLAIQAQDDTIIQNLKGWVAGSAVGLVDDLAAAGSTGWSVARDQTLAIVLSRASAPR
jgi:hypothetical protein